MCLRSHSWWVEDRDSIQAVWLQSPGSFPGPCAAASSLSQDNAPCVLSLCYWLSSTRQRSCGPGEINPPPAWPGKAPRPPRAWQTVETQGTFAEGQSCAHSWPWIHKEHKAHKTSESEETLNRIRCNDLPKGLCFSEQRSTVGTPTCSTSARRCLLGRCTWRLPEVCHTEQARLLLQKGLFRYWTQPWLSLLPDNLPLSSWGSESPVHLRHASRNLLYSTGAMPKKVTPRFRGHVPSEFCLLPWSMNSGENQINVWYISKATHMWLK